MDFKELRAAKTKKAQSMIESSGGKVDSSTWTPDEKLNAEAKTGMRPISRRAFKAGGKVEGEKAKTNLSRTPRGGFKETVGLANTNQKDANEEREGIKHVGGMKNGGRTKRADGGTDDDGYTEGVDYEMRPMENSNSMSRHMFTRAEKAARAAAANESASPAKAPVMAKAPVRAKGSSFPKGAVATDMDTSKGTFGTPAASNSRTAVAARTQGTPLNMGSSPAVVSTSPFPRTRPQTLSDMTNGSTISSTKTDLGPLNAPPLRSDLSPDTSTRPRTRLTSPQPPLSFGTALKKGGAVKKKYEGSPKDNMMDARMAKKKGMTHKEWEASPEDKRMDAKGQREMDQRTGKAGGGEMAMIAPAARLVKSPEKAIAGGLLAGMKKGGKAEEAHEKGCACAKCSGGRMGRATGGRAKGKTNIVINVMPHTPAKPPMGIQPPMPMPPVGGPPPMGAMPPPPPSGGGGGLPPGLMSAMTGAAGAGPMPPAGPPPMMGRKDGGKVYPKMKFGAGSGEGRLEKIEKYGKNA